MRHLLLALVVSSVAGCFYVTPYGPVSVSRSIGPTYQVIPGTGISVVSNVVGNVFYYNGLYYRYHSNRWWSSRNWNSGWRTLAFLPHAFGRIPNGHSKHWLTKSMRFNSGNTKNSPHTPSKKTGIFKGSKSNSSNNSKAGSSSSSGKKNKFFGGGTKKKKPKK